MSTFRKEYRQLTATEQESVEQIKDAAERLDILINIAGAEHRSDLRTLALARTKLEECVMWAVKGIT